MATSDEIAKAEVVSTTMVTVQTAAMVFHDSHPSSALCIMGCKTHKVDERCPKFESWIKSAVDLSSDMMCLACGSTSGHRANQCPVKEIIMRKSYYAIRAYCLNCHFPKYPGSQCSAGLNTCSKDAVKKIAILVARHPTARHMACEYPPFGVLPVPIPKWPSAHRFETHEAQDKAAAAFMSWVCSSPLNVQFLVGWFATNQERYVYSCFFA